MPRFAGGGRYRPKHDDQDDFAQSLAAGQARSDAITEGYEEIARADRERMSISSREDWSHNKGAEQRLKDAWNQAIHAREEQLQRLETMTSTSGGYEDVVNPRTGRREFVFSKEIDRLQNEIQTLEDDYQTVFERPEFEDEGE